MAQVALSYELRITNYELRVTSYEFKVRRLPAHGGAKLVPNLTPAP